MQAPATALGRHDRIWPAVLLSAAVHAALIAVAASRGGPAIDLEQKPIVARLVRLGEARPPEWLPRKEAAPPPPAPAAPVAPPLAAAAPAPQAPGGKAPGTAGTAPGAGRSLSDVLSRVRKQVEEERWGSPEGDPMGDASEGEAGDRYLALAKQALQANYNVPATISEKERLYLKAVVVLYVEPDGRIAGWRFEARSGNPAFDAALERAIRQTRLPPPPPEVRDRFRKSGFGVNFHI
ncbi:MAG TPA: energy transducer TonB [Anaeromyxobacteraceae bacterium]|nr:energy transducer TonB [Anaeromyxobacteraceae bacterium]